MRQATIRALRRWNDKPRSIRFLTCTLLALGLVLGIVGVRLDSIDWWTGHDYVLNMYSALTGVCFGIPFAILLFSKLTRDLEETRQGKRILELARNEGARFQEALASLFTIGDLAELSAKVTDLSDRIENLRQVPRDEPTREREIDRLTDEFGDLLDLSHRGRPGSVFRGTSKEWGTVDHWRTQVTSQWNILYNDVRPSLPNRSWIPIDTGTKALQAVERLLKQGRNPWRANGRSEREIALRYFLKDLTALCHAAKAFDAYM